MGAKVQPPENSALKLWMLGLALLSVTGIGGIFLLRADPPAWAVGISFAPSSSSA
jgi:hypothetical protein